MRPCSVPLIRTVPARLVNTIKSPPLITKPKKLEFRLPSVHNHEKSENDENSNQQNTGGRKKERASRYRSAPHAVKTPFVTTVLDYEIRSTSSRGEASGGEQMTADDKGICFTPSRSP
ncbi:hypothetical protein QQF64_035315 [Cirrhinus molitorella]|uniref:Uncharacterized protein n=1 Tax=Cirrhinus molitorella TaxID=172907 RepID=A0ABR3NFQ2_9TELE